ncbi:hypothetical protein FHQ18_07610 [Deferribacter autotrophicus]|uniref:Uncharacterized domain-containing protein n=1 Tax=Deferribacter autotrophicus TaxID=500465 RepID=A0A5A8F467_9BACT|nr:TraI domain-containing protein [Deferribacter autotrophicus]KAA0258251.1 hypothetical protein FHQ18_07610 [Deferribacter autotrophicus]
MIFSFFKNKNQKNDIETSINEIIASHEQFFVKIDNLLPSYKDVAYKLFYDVIRRFIRKIYDAPASEKHHHSEPFGLLKHSLETVIHALIEQHKILELKYDTHGNLDSQFNLKNKERVLYRTAISALFHDAGKMFDFIIRDGNVVFDPLEDNLLDFKLKYPNCELIWKPNRTKKHEKRNIILLFDILTQQDRKYLSAVNFLQLIDDFFGYDPKDTLQELIKEADIRSVTKTFTSTSKKEEKVTKQTEKGNYIQEEDETILLTNYFLKSLQDLVNQNTFAINRLGGQLFVLDTVTFVVNPLVIEKSLVYMRKKYNYKTTKNHIISILKDKNVIISDESGKTFFHADILFPNGKKITLNFIIIKNKFLWGCSKPENFAGEIKLKDFISIDMDEEVKETESEKTKLPETPKQETKQENQSDKNTTSSNDEPKENNQIQEQEQKHEQENTSAKQKQKKKLPLYEKLILTLKNMIKGNVIELTTNSEQPIFITTINKQKYIAIKYPQGFDFIAEKTGFYDVSSPDRKKEIERICNSLNNSNYVLLVDKRCVVNIEIKGRIIKSVLVYSSVLF